MKVGERCLCCSQWSHFLNQYFFFLSFF